MLANWIPKATYEFHLRRKARPVALDNIDTGNQGKGSVVLDVANYGNRYAIDPTAVVYNNGFGLHHMAGNVWEWVYDW